MPLLINYCTGKQKAATCCGFRVLFSNKYLLYLKINFVITPQQGNGSVF
jgi:hypothetical protein